MVFVFALSFNTTNTTYAFDLNPDNAIVTVAVTDKGVKIGEISTRKYLLKSEGWKEGETVSAETAVKIFDREDEIAAANKAAASKMKAR